MDYNAKITNKPNNLIDVHNKHEKYFEDKMKWMERKNGLTQEDERLWFKRDKNGDEDYGISISGSCLLQCGDGLFFWRKLQIMSNKYDENELKFILKSYLYDFGLRFFIDEDGCNGLFNGKTSDEKMSFVYCYISPDFPEGYFENHSLEAKPCKPW